MTKQINVAVTHSSVFHADDVIAAAILRGINPQVRFVRSRREQDWSAADVVFDVGGRHDPEAGVFDHHQRERAGARGNGVLFSSAGLLWRHFGLVYLEAVAGGAGVDLAELHDRVDEVLIMAIDAVDNGQTVEPPTTLRDRPDTAVRVQDLSNVFSVLNPVGLFEADTEEAFNEAFEVAVGFAGLVLRKITLREAATLRARDEIRAADTGEPILVMERFYPWQEVVCGEMPHVHFVVFPSPDGSWKVQVVPQEIGQFAARKDLPEVWKGLRDAELAAVTGVADAIFCHPGRFIAGARSREGALALARLAVA